MHDDASMTPLCIIDATAGTMAVDMAGAQQP